MNTIQNAAKKYNRSLDKAKITDYNEILKKRKQRDNEKKQKRLRRFKVFKVLSFMMFFAVLFGANLYLRTEIYSTKCEIRAANEEIKKLESSLTEKQVYLENLFSYTTLEKKARALGMQPASENQIHKIDTKRSNYAEIIK